MHRQRSLLIAASWTLACTTNAVDPSRGTDTDGTSTGPGLTSGVGTQTTTPGSSGGAEGSSSSATPDDLPPAGTSGSGEGTAETSVGTTGDDPPAGCDFPGVTDFADAGPFEVQNEPGGDACTMLRPVNIGEGGRLHPVILWGNGTTATPLIYNRVLRHWASHGFIVAAANTTNAGTGTEMLACLEWVTAQNDDAASPYAGAVDLEHIGASGHSQGGGGALMVGQDPRLTVTAPLEPYTEQGFGGFDQASLSMQSGPMFLMSGELDAIAPRIPNQQRVFDQANGPVFWGTLAGADHVASAIGDITGFRGPATAWFRYHLMCDETARPTFYDACALCSDAMWDVQTTNW